MTAKPALCQMNRAALCEQRDLALHRVRTARTRKEVVAARAHLTRIQRRLAVTTH